MACGSQALDCECCVGCSPPCLPSSICLRCSLPTCSNRGGSWKSRISFSSPAQHRPPAFTARSAAAWERPGVVGMEVVVVGHKGEVAELFGPDETAASPVSAAEDLSVVRPIMKAEVN
jgi:hypothetical protein